MVSQRAGIVASLLVLIVAVGAGDSRTAVQYGSAVVPVSNTEKWVRVDNVDASDSLRTVEFKGDDFVVTGIKSVRASGASTPTCSVSTLPADSGLVRCDGELPPQSSLFLNVTVAGGGGNFQIAASDDPNDLELAPGAQGPPFLPIDAKLVTLGPRTKQVTLTGGGAAFDELEILPFGFTIEKVSSVASGHGSGSCEAEGRGIDCSFDLPPRSTGVVTFETSGPGGTAEVLLSGAEGVGDQYVTQVAGSPAKYDLIASARPATIRYRRGRTIRGIPISFAVLNAKDAVVPSGYAFATAKVVGASPRAVLGAKVSCPIHNPVALSLAPGASKTACSLSLTPSPTTLLKPGRVDIVLSVACARNLEVRCANNRALATIVVD